MFINDNTKNGTKSLTYEKVKQSVRTIYLRP